MEEKAVNTKIQKMIEEMCPDGVEYRRLGDVTVMKRGTSLTKKKAEEGSIPVISGGRLPAFYCNQSNREGETITVAGSGAGAGFVQYWNKPIFACDCFTVKGTEALDTRYVYHWMTSMQDAIYSCKKGGGVPHVHISDIDSFEIPVPPLAVQQEVVRVLDTMTELTTKLTAELTARTKQYAYYRDELLKLEGIEGVEYKRVGDIFKRLRGTPITARKMKEIAREDGNIRIFAGGKTVIDASESDIPKANIIRVPAVLVQSRGIVDFVYYDKPFTFKNEMWAYTADNTITVKYLYYCLKNSLERFRDEASKMGSMPQISIRITEDFVIPIPPLSVQQDIVTKLDAFSSYCTDLTTGLPAEIAAREKQYAYYRDAILQFNGK